MLDDYRHFLRRVIVAVVLLGFAMQAALPAWHHGAAAHGQAHRSLPALTDSELAADLDAIINGVMCGDVTSPPAGAAQKPQLPSKQPQPDCPVCACLAGAAFAIMADALPILPAPLSEPANYWHRDAASADKALLLPRSRGPPRAA